MVGERLREEREKKGFTLGDIAARTHIRVEYLRCIENGNFQKIPSDIYVRGYLKAYAELLGIRADTILSRYDADKTGKDEEQSEIPKASEERFISKKYIFIGSMAFLSLAVIIFFSALNIIKSGTLSNKHTANEGSAGGLRGPVNLKIIANDTTWIMMVIDNDKIEEYILKKGDVLVREGDRGFYIKIGNASGVSIFFNNENIGNLGKKGEVVTVSIPQEFKLDKSFKYLFQNRKPVK